MSIESNTPQDQLYLMLRHILDRLDKVGDRLDELSGHKDKIDQISKRVDSFDKKIHEMSESLIIMKHDQKKKEETRNSLMNPVIQKVASTVILFFIGGMIGIFINNANFKQNDAIQHISRN